MTKKEFLEEFKKRYRVGDKIKRAHDSSNNIYTLSSIEIDQWDMTGNNRNVNYAICHKHDINCTLCTVFYNKKWAKIVKRANHIHISGKLKKDEENIS